MDSQRQYHETLSNCILSLEALYNDMSDKAILLALSRCWSEWADAAPIGTILEVNEEKLQQTQDKNIQALLKLLAETLVAIEALKA